MTPVDPGSLRHRLDLEADQGQPDGYGGRASRWEKRFSVWASLKPVSARSVEEAGNRIAEITHEALVRKRQGILAGTRFRKGERIFSILTVRDPDETGRYLLCALRELG